MLENEKVNKINDLYLTHEKRPVSRALSQ